MTLQRFPLLFGTVAIILLVLLAGIASRPTVATAQSFDDVVTSSATVNHQAGASRAEIAGVRSDCNSDAAIDVADIVTIGHNIFAQLDENATTREACDANEDTHIDAGDIACNALRMFDVAVSCPAPNRAVTAAVTLTIAPGVYGAPGSRIDVPISFVANGNTINSVAFSLDIDEAGLRFDNSDGDNNGIPDALTLTPPAGYRASVVYDRADVDGEIDIFFADIFPPYMPLTDGQLATIALTVAEDALPGTVYGVAFSAEPPPSFGETRGSSQSGTTSNGSIVVSSVPTTIMLSSLQSVSSNGLILAAAALLCLLTMAHLKPLSTRSS